MHQCGCKFSGIKFSFLFGLNAWCNCLHPYNSSETSLSFELEPFYELIYIVLKLFYKTFKPNPCYFDKLQVNFGFAQPVCTILIISSKQATVCLEEHMQFVVQAKSRSLSIGFDHKESLTYTFILPYSHPHSFTVVTPLTFAET